MIYDIIFNEVRITTIRFRVWKMISKEPQPPQSATSARDGLTVRLTCKMVAEETLGYLLRTLHLRGGSFCLLGRCRTFAFELMAFHRAHTKNLVHVQHIEVHDSFTPEELTVHNWWHGWMKERSYRVPRRYVFRTAINGSLQILATFFLRHCHLKHVGCIHFFTETYDLLWDWIDHRTWLSYCRLLLHGIHDIRFTYTDHPACSERYLLSAEGVYEWYTGDVICKFLSLGKVNKTWE